MSTSLAFQVDFHGPVRVGTGRAGDGLDDTVDADRIPASSLKGLMRAESRRLFGTRLTDATFGDSRPSAWHWSDLTFTEVQALRVTARIRIDEATGSAAHGGLFLTGHLWPEHGAFRITRMAPLTDEQTREQSDVLLASALAVHSIGADRTRGYGWVSIRRRRADGTVDHDVTGLVDRILALTGREQNR